MIVIVVAAAAGEGELGVELLPPQLPHKTTAIDTTAKPWSRIPIPHSPRRHPAELQGTYPAMPATKRRITEGSRGESATVLRAT
jgi:hypothetical protein